MEIKFNNVSIENNKLSLCISDNRIIGIYGDERELFLKIISKDITYDGEIVDNGVFNDILFINEYSKFMTDFPKDELYLLLNGNTHDNRILAVLKELRLTEDFLERQISTMPSSLKKMLKIMLATLSNNKTIVITGIFDGLDFNNKKLITKFLHLMKKYYHKLIFIYDNDIDTIYSLVDNLLIVDKSLIIFDKKEVVLCNSSISKVNIAIPLLFSITDYCHSNGFKIKYTSCVNDFIREVRSHE